MDPNHFDTDSDPDPAFHFGTDQDPTFHFDTDPDLTVDMYPDPRCFKEVVCLQKWYFY